MTTEGHSADCVADWHGWAVAAENWKLRLALSYAREHLAHTEHGVDLCFVCFLEGEIDKLLGPPEQETDRTILRGRLVERLIWERTDDA